MQSVHKVATEIRKVGAYFVVNMTKFPNKLQVITLPQTKPGALRQQGCGALRQLPALPA